MFLLIVLLLTQSIGLGATIPFDGIIHRAVDGSSYAFLSPPRTGNHASFIEQMTPSGTLAVAWFTGGEGTPNCSIAVSLLEVGSQKFTEGVIVSERVNYSNQNPVLYWDNETQILHLYHSSQLGNAGESTSEIWHLESKDRGATWSTPEAFYSEHGAFDRNRLIPAFNSSELIFPCYNSTPLGSYSFLVRFFMGQHAVTIENVPQSKHLIQPTIIRLGNSSRLRAFFRDTNAEWIYSADSDDDGHQWTVPKPTTLPNNNSGIQANILKSGAMMMVFNNHNGTRLPRSPLTVALSYDEGMSWPYHRDVQIHDDDSTHVGEYSYPSLLQTFWSGSDENDIHLVYTYGRETIKYLRFNENWVKQGQ